MQKKSQYRISCGIMRKASTFSGNSDVVGRASNREFREKVLKEVSYLGEERNYIILGFQAQGDFKPSDATHECRKKQEQNGEETRAERGIRSWF